MDKPVNISLAATVRAARAARGWTLDQFASASGVSRAMISKIERDEVSPTAAVLARLAAGLDVSLASLFAAGEPAASPLSRWEDQRDWQDPESGYVRRNVSPPGAATQIVYVSFPAGARVVFDNATASRGLEQQVWMLEGGMSLSIGEETTALSVGDCLVMRLDQPIIFHNPGEGAARYMVVIARATA
jgi:transcriptional regulator with XRE-family HTH domain